MNFKRLMQFEKSPILNGLKKIRDNTPYIIGVAGIVSVGYTLPATYFALDDLSHNLDSLNRDLGSLCEAFDRIVQPQEVTKSVETVTLGYVTD